MVGRGKHDFANAVPPGGLIHIAGALDVGRTHLLPGARRARISSQVQDSRGAGEPGLRGGEVGDVSRDELVTVEGGGWLAHIQQTNAVVLAQQRSNGGGDATAATGDN